MKLHKKHDSKNTVLGLSYHFNYESACYTAKREKPTFYNTGGSFLRSTMIITATRPIKGKK